MQGCRAQPRRWARAGRREGSESRALLTRRHVGDAPALCLASVAVLPEYQRTGAGSAATRAALDEALMALALDPERHPLPSGTVRYAAPFGI